MLDELDREVERVIAGPASAHGCRAEVVITAGYPATVNDARATQIVADTAIELLGEEHFHPLGGSAGQKEQVHEER